MPTPNINPQSDPTLFAPISTYWLTLQPQYSRLRQACVDDQQREDLDQRYGDAEAAYWAAVRHALVDNNATVKELVGELNQITTDLTTNLQTLQNIAAVINLIAQGAKLAASLVTLAAP